MLDVDWYGDCYVDDDLFVVDLDEPLWGVDSNEDEHGEDVAAIGVATATNFAQGPLMDADLEAVASMSNLIYDIVRDPTV